MRVRDAGPGDLDRLLELYEDPERLYRNVEPLNQNRAEDLFTRVLLDPNQRTLVAEVYDEVVGTVVLVVLPNLAHGGAPYAVVENVVVDEEYRGEGVGRTLIEEAMKLAREAGAYKLTLSANTGRDGADGFYRSLGFEETHVGFEVRA